MPEEKITRLGVSIDGVMLGRVDPQHRKRKSEKKGKVRGKKALENFFHEVKTLVVFEFNKAKRSVAQNLSRDARPH